MSSTRVFWRRQWRGIREFRSDFARDFLKGALLLLGLWAIGLLVRVAEWSAAWPEVFHVFEFVHAVSTILAQLIISYKFLKRLA